MAATPTRGLVQSQNPLAECDRAGNPVELIIWVFWPEGGGVLAWEWGARDGRGVTPGWSFTCGPEKQTIIPSVKDLSYSPLHMTILPTLKFLCKKVFTRTWLLQIFLTAKQSFKILLCFKILNKYVVHFTITSQLQNEIVIKKITLAIPETVNHYERDKSLSSLTITMYTRNEWVKSQAIHVSTLFLKSI